MSRESRRGPKPENGVHRVRLLGYGPWVRRETDERIKLWRTAYGVPAGRTIDAAIAFASANKDFFLTTK